MTKNTMPEKAVSISKKSKSLKKGELLFCQNDSTQVFLSARVRKFHISDWFRNIALILARRLREVDSKINRTVDVNSSNHISIVSSLTAATNQNTSSENSMVNCKFHKNKITDLFHTQVSSTLKALESQKKKILFGLNIQKSLLLCKWTTIEKMTNHISTAN